MAVQFVCGAECKIVTGASGTNHWNSVTGTPTIGTAEPGGGTGSFSWSASAVTIFHQLTLSQAVLAGRVYIQLSALPAGNMSILRAQNGSGDSMDYRVSSGGSVFQAINGASVGTLGTVTTATWYRIDFLIDNTTTAITMKGRLDGGTEASGGATGVGSTLTFFRVGVITTGMTTVMLGDHLILGNASGDYPFGAGQVTGYVPTSTGAHNQTAGDLVDHVPANVTNGDGSWADIDELPANTTDFVAQAVIRTTTYAEYVYGTSGATGAPRGVEQVVSVQGGAANTEKAQLYDGTTAVDAYALTATAAGITNRTTQWASPPSGGSWTNGQFTALRIRWGFSNDVTPNPQLSSTVVEAEFAPVVATDPPPFRPVMPPLLAQ